MCDEKLILSFNIQNSYGKNEDLIGKNKMFSVSKKLNVPLLPENEDEEEIDLYDEEDESESDSDIYDNNNLIKKEINNNNRCSSVSNQKDENTKTNSFNNVANNSEGIKFEKIVINERFSFKDNLRDGHSQNILVNNINNIHNINIVNNDITNIHNINKLSNFGLLNKKSSLKMNAGLPPIFNDDKKICLRAQNKEEYFNGNLI